MVVVSRLALLAVAASALALAGCATTPEPQLTPGSATPPADLDLSGEWILRNADTDELSLFSAQSAIGARNQRMLSRRAAAGRATQSGARRGGDQRPALAQVFLETGTRVKLTQTDTGLFISYDRSIVEEYRFGEHRLASVGPVLAERASGWDGDSYVVETLDEDNVLLRERWQLVAGGQVLERTVEFIEKEEVAYAVTQVFDRRR